MNRKTAIALVTLAALVASVVALVMWRQSKATSAGRPALAHARQLARVLETPTRDSRLRDMVVVPGVCRNRTSQEQEDFLRKALKDEVSEDGLDVLASTGVFGPLREVFPEEAHEWTGPHGLDPAECVAFRATKGALRAELVLHVAEDDYRVVRCNNIRQLAVP